MGVDIVEPHGTVTMVIADNGIGFDPGARTEGLGLLGMRERVALAGGSIDIVSVPGEGTTITVAVPARHRAPDRHPAEHAQKSNPDSPPPL